MDTRATCVSKTSSLKEMKCFLWRVSHSGDQIHQDLWLKMERKRPIPHPLTVLVLVVDGWR